MRKHDVRKWIHAVLDMLPLFIIPIFAIYMHRHPSTEYEVTTGGYEITEKYETNDVNSLSDLVVGNIYFFDSSSISSNTLICYCNAIYGYRNNELLSLSLDSFDSSYYIRFYCNANNILQASFTDGNIDLYNYTLDKYGDIYFVYRSNFSSNLIEYVSASDDYLYDVIYNESLTYNDTDIGSQFVYALYLPIEKYFNFNNVATFNNMYQWFTTNFFNGEVPLVVPIVWNIILYEFIMDVLFLIYAVFMFIIDFVECLIDKAFGKSYRGGR